MDDRTGDLFVSENGDDASPIERHASQAYLGYAVSTVKARALPEIADGLKPSVTLGDSSNGDHAIRCHKPLEYVGYGI